MKLTIEINNFLELEKLLNLLNSFKIDNIKVVSNNKQQNAMVTEQEDVIIAQPFIVKGDESIDTTELFGIWKDNPRTLEDIRTKAWKRNLDL